MTIYTVSTDPNLADLIPPTKMSKTPRPSCYDAPSPINVASFPSNGWMTTTRPTKCIVSSRIGQIIGYKDYYFEDKRVLCTRAFSTTAVSTTVDDGYSPPGSTELDKETGHNCKMTKDQYRNFTRFVLGLDDETWANHRTESTFRNMILQDLDALHTLSTKYGGKMKLHNKLLVGLVATSL